MEDDSQRQAPQAWIDALDRADKDVAAGRTVPWDEVRARLEAEIALPTKAKLRRKA